MARGRNKLPRETLALRGTLRNDRERPSSVMGTPIKLEEVALRCQTSGLRAATPRARKIYWRKVREAAALGILEPQDLPQLLAYAADYDWLISATESLNKDGLVIKQGKKTTTTKHYPDGTIEVKEVDERLDMPNPIFKQAMQLQDKLRQLGGNFGFSPIDRQKLKIVQQSDAPKGFRALFAAVVADNDDGPEEQ